ncbi:MAG TPA: anthranilate synthase component I family protein [Phenylobacterium sp.]|nr:anthranilate synthase component I family protein [Phenylobacterium sp.]
MRFAVTLRAPWRDPAEVLAGFAEEAWALAFLSGGGGDRARWSYLARDPDAVLTLRPTDAADPFEALAGLLGEDAPGLPDGPPFQGGVAGLAAYELGDRVEPLGLARSRGWPDLAVGRYPAILAFDHQRREVVAVGRGADGAAAQAQARRALAWADMPPRPLWSGPLTDGLTASPGPAYESAVAQVVSRIRAGEMFQANIARPWTGRLVPGAAPFDILIRLAARSAAPFAAYLRLADLAVVSNSPERFLRVDAAGRAESRPIKGTRPRSPCRIEDAALARQLRASDKDRAENLMIVDLMRNDLARVCTPGSVAVPGLWDLESFVNVHHLVSTVTGRLAPGRRAVDLLRAAFPPGSVTGAPKVQAMKTIARLEPPRGPYCGSMFWAGFDGAFDSSVLIRTAACARDDGGWRVEARAGAGIVADSDPAAERRETEDKIAALVEALTGPGA